MNPDDILRAATTRHSGELEVAETFARKSEDELYLALGEHLSGIRKSAHISKDADDNTRGRPEPEDIQRASATSEFGKRVFMRWSVAFHDFVCNPGVEDKSMRDQLTTAIIGKGGGAAAIIAASLVAAFGMQVATAAIVAALLLRLIVVPAGEELCATWTKFNRGMRAK